MTSGEEASPASGLAVRRAAAAHVFVDDVVNPELNNTDLHHLQQVLRLRPNELFTVSDGNGQWRECRWDTALRVDGPVYTEQRLSPEIVVAFAIPKGDRPEQIVRQLTELGVDRMIPMHVERSVVRWEGARGIKHLDRLRRVAREAAMQSRTVFLSSVEDVQPFSVVVNRAGVAVADLSGDAPTLDRPVVLIGPEGGWSPPERDQSPAFLTLGTHVLRVETASVVAGALLTALRSQVVGPSSTEAGSAFSG